MSDQSDNQNRSEEQVHLSEGTSPSSSSDDGSRSTPSNLPKAATRARKNTTREKASNSAGFRPISSAGWCATDKALQLTNSSSVPPPTLRLN